MTEPRFIHLRVHSDYSMIDGLAKIDLLVKKAAFLHMPALAITDFINLHGIIKFYRTAYSFGIKPIIGIDCLISNKLFGNELMELTLLAANNIGYDNLIYLISKAYQFGYKSTIGPIIQRDWLSEYNQGIILLSGGCKGDVGTFLIKGDILKVKECLNFYQNYFSECYYLEIIRTGRQNEEKYINSIILIAIKYNLPLVADNDVRFINQSDFDAHKIRVAIHSNTILDDYQKSNKYSSQQFLRSEQDMCNIFSDCKEALTNSVEIARRCNVTINFNKYFLPKFPTGNMSEDKFLIIKSHEGLQKRLKFLFPDKKNRIIQEPIYNRRLNSELNIINKMGFPGYFLIVMEFIQWAKNNGIPVGPGRGSGTGSLVAYALQITDLDPLKFDLIFERFLNTERISMPDFDIDFCMEKRDLVIDHVATTYGKKAVSQIITFGTMTAKAVIRDVGRVLGYPYNFINRISKLIPSDPGMTLKKAFILETKLQEIFNSDEEVKTLINMAYKLEGVIRNVSKHAGGVVIAPNKIIDFVPLYCDPNGNNAVTQFDKNDIEHIGLVKFDFLGLRTLTAINKSLEIINNKLSEKKIPIVNISMIKLNDKKVFDTLKSTETTAIFQLESRGMRDLIKRLRPDCFEDIIALVALFRPGPLQSGMVDNFINRKHGKEKIYYPDSQWQHQLLKPILESTYGIILYQEQVMQIAQVLAGYTLEDADILRRAIGKKKPKEMAEQRSIFYAGTKNFGIDKNLSVKIFDLLEKFADYGFNKSHSAAYALLSYQTLWLKTYYPAEFMAAVMTTEMDNTNKISNLIHECWRMNLKVLPPDINSSQYYFHVNQKEEIIYGMGAIKGIGAGFIKDIITTRNNYGNFNNLFNLCLRLTYKKLNKQSLEKLIMSGACDTFKLHRAALIKSLDDIIKAVNQIHITKCIGQKDMFDIPIEKITSFYKKVTPWSESVLLKKEYEVIGLYLTNHPINQYLKEIKYYSNNIIKLKNISKIQNKIVTVVGLIILKRILKDRNGDTIIVCTLDDHSGFIDAIFMHETIEKYKFLLDINNVIIISGKLKFYNNYKIIVHKLMDIDSARKKYVSGITIFVNYKTINVKLLNNLRSSLKPYQSGDTPIFIIYQKDDMYIKLRFSDNWMITINNNLLNDLYTIFDSKQIKFEFNTEINHELKFSGF